MPWSNGRFTVLSLEGRLRRMKWLQDHRCHYCRRELRWRETTLDHVVPVAKCGEMTEENTVVACQSCNQKKADKEAI